MLLKKKKKKSEDQYLWGKKNLCGLGAMLIYLIFMKDFNINKVTENILLKF